MCNSLGVMLYELLVGVLPFDQKTLRQAGLDEVRRRIREVDPPRPSTKASTLGEASSGSARLTAPSRGGSDPAWHPNGRELSFLAPADATGKRRMMVATFDSGSPPRIGNPRPLFEVGGELSFSSWLVRGYDVAADGLRF